MLDDIPVRLTLMQAIAWISTRDDRIVQRATWKRADGADPLGGDAWPAVEACFPPGGGITLLSLNLWNCADLPEASVLPTFICDSDLCWVGDKDSIAERAIAALLLCLNNGALVATYQADNGKRRKIPAEDWEDRFLESQPYDATELLPYRKRAMKPETGWREVRVSREDLLREWPPRSAAANCAVVDNSSAGSPHRGLREKLSRYGDSGIAGRAKHDRACLEGAIPSIHRIYERRRTPA